MTARVLVLGLDAAEATLIERWADEGALPGFARLIREGASARLANCLETLPGAIWPEINTGRSAGTAPLYYHPAQLRTGEAAVRPIEPHEIEAEDFYWTIASRAGAHVAVVDPVQCVAAPGLDGAQLLEWGLHDRTFGVSSDPASLLDELRAEGGEHPVPWCDRHGESFAGYRRLLGALIDGVERKARFCVRLLRRERWDLFVATFGESHCVGHQFWHFLDPYRPGRDDPDPPRDLRDAIATVYGAIDRALVRLIDAAGSDAAVIVVASHGMGRYTAGPQLLPEMLARLGMGSAWPGFSRPGSLVRGLQRNVSHAPRGFQPGLRRVASGVLARPVQEAVGCLLDPLTSRRTRAVALKNNRCGAIRLNLSGREPHGEVRAGTEAQAILAELRAELGALVEPRSGEPIVVRTVSAEEAFRTHCHPDVPDLMVVFRTDLGVLETARSPRLGTIRVPNYHPNIPRSGDHTVESRAWLLGCGASQRVVTGASVLDVAPTALALLGIEPPGWMRRRSLA